MRTLVLGAAGMLGHKLCEVLSSSDRHEVYGAVRKPASLYERYAPVFERTRLVGELDVLDESRLAETLGEVGPEAIVNCVGIVKQLEEAEDLRLSIQINSLLPHTLARLSERIGARLIHISTDCVFAGSRGRYRESDDSDAKDVYGRTKYLGETDASEAAAVTLRTSIIGRELGRPTHGLIEWFLAQHGCRVDGYAKAVFSGFTTLELARVIERVMEGGQELRGVYHVASAPINKYDLLLLALRHFDMDVTVDRQDSFVCDRSLVMDRFSAAIDYSPPSWDDMIRELANDQVPYGSWQAPSEA